MRRAPLLLAVLPLVLAACGESTYDKPVQELVGSTMGTTFSVKIVDPPTNLDLVALQDEVQAALDDINQTMSTYIEDSVAMLRTNLLLGIGLAISILWWFMRRFRATFIVALAIPVSLLTAFVIMQITGRSLNMISLAGLAFATGMVLDAAIVVLENIVRLRATTN